MNILKINKDISPIYWENNFLTDIEINKIIEYVKDLPTEKAGIGGNHDVKNKIKKKKFTIDYHIKDFNISSGVEPKVRITDIKWIESIPEVNWLFEKIINKINEVNYKNFNMTIKFVENLQFSEYSEDQKGFYGLHQDVGDPKSDNNFLDIRKISFTIQLTDENDYEGGELILYNEPEKIVAPKTKGTIIFFESDMAHEVKPVKKGVRHSLVSWVRGPNLR